MVPNIHGGKKTETKKSLQNKVLFPPKGELLTLQEKEGDQ